MAQQKRGRKPKKEADKVQTKPVYLTKKEWAAVAKKFGTPTKAMRDVVLSQCE
jgi:hypothetical protein